MHRHRRKHTHEHTHERTDDSLEELREALSAEFWDERYAGTGRVWSGRPNQRLVEQVADLTPGKALDVACGEGGDAIWLAEQGWRSLPSTCPRWPSPRWPSTRTRPGWTRASTGTLPRTRGSAERTAPS